MDSNAINLKKIDYKILIIMRRDKKMTKYEAVTKKQLCELCDVSLSTITISIKNLLKLEYIDYGLKDGSAKTYYLTDKGKDDLVETCFKGQIKIKSKMEE